MVIENGYPEERITIANNAIDAAAIVRCCEEQYAESRRRIREELGIKAGSKVALYCGRLIDNKVSFHAESLEAVRQQNEAFEVIVIGTGPQEAKIQSYAEKHHWFHYMGAVYGDDRAKYFCIADLFLMPGLVGLAILVAFAVGDTDNYYRLQSA